LITSIHCCWQLGFVTAASRVLKLRRFSAIELQPQLLVNFQALLAEFTAGDPMREGVLWTNLPRFLFAAIQVMQ